MIRTRTITIQRRTLIQGGGLATLASMLPPVAFARAAGSASASTEIAVQTASALFRGPEATDAADTHLPAQFSALYGRLDDGMRADVDLLLKVVEWGPLPLAGIWGRFSGLDRGRQVQYLAGWHDHWLPQIRTAARALKLIFAPLYFSDPATWTAIGYDGPWIGRIDVPYFELAPHMDETSIDELLE